MIQRIVFATCLFCLAATAFAGQPDAYSAGLAAYRAGSFSTAVRDFRSVAKHGYAPAQYNLGVTYDTVRPAAEGRARV